MRQIPASSNKQDSIINVCKANLLVLASGVLSCLFFSCSNDGKGLSDTGNPVKFNIPEGFLIEHLYRPAARGEGSWVSLARGPENDLFAGDQFGAIYRLQMEDGPKGLEVQAADSLPLGLGYAQGLLYHRDTLYISVNRKWEDSGEGFPGSGVYRAWDSDDDGLPDAWDQLVRLEGYGEHGPHSLVMKPDSSGLVLVAGNHTLVPEIIQSNSLVPNLWAEDQLLEPFPDPRGHAVDIKAPGGWIASYNFADSDWELRSSGYRNPFDIAFWNGELFTYDSDMEWDLGMPWYRPTRICHVVSGSEFGWRTGSGKWPASFPDNLPAAVSMLQGSPTALLSGDQLAFPETYRNGIFAADWSFGTLYFVRLDPRGATYRGEREEFMSGTPLPLADMIAGPDGNLYFVSGGRELESGLYRLRPDRAETSASMAEASSSIMEVEMATPYRARSETDMARLRKSFEVYHRQRADIDALDSLWEGLSHSDRFVRYAARIALEHQPADTWANNFLREANTDAVIQAGIALSRLGQDNFRGAIHRAFRQLEWQRLSDRQKTDLIRAIGLAFTRLPASKEDEKEPWITYFAGTFPSGIAEIDMALGELMVYLEAPGIAGKILNHMESLPTSEQNGPGELLEEQTLRRSEQYGPTISQMIARRPPKESIHYMKILSRLSDGWTPELRREYYSRFYDVLASEGGMSFKAYMEKMRVASLQGLPASEIAAYEELSGVYRPGDLLADLPQPIGPGKAYTVDMLTPYIWGDGLDAYTGTPEDGYRAFQAALCIVCHRIQGEGGASGPDLSQVSSKFGGYDLINTILSPNDQISDQYANVLLEMEDGSKIAGRVREENDSTVILMPNPYDPEQVLHIDKVSITKRGISPVSPMPPGLLNRLNEQEVQDLLVYLLSNANPEHPLYD